MRLISRINSMSERWVSHILIDLKNAKYGKNGNCVSVIKLLDKHIVFT